MKRFLEKKIARIRQFVIFFLSWSIRSVRAQKFKNLSFFHLMRNNFFCLILLADEEWGAERERDCSCSLLQSWGIEGSRHLFMACIHSPVFSLIHVQIAPAIAARCDRWVWLFVVFDLHITGIIYFFFIIGEKRKIPFLFQLGRLYITAVFSVQSLRSSSWASRKKTIWKTTTERRKKRRTQKMTSPSLPRLSKKKQLSADKVYSVWIPY